MASLRSISIIGMFTSLIIATNFLLFQFPNIKLEDTLVFSSAYAFGWKIGVSVAILSELIWGITSPYGFGGPIIPFLIAGEIIYAIAGALTSRVWGRIVNTRSAQNLFLGTIIAICAFLFDIETNVFTSIVVTGRLTVIGVLATIATGAWFMVTHELSDLILGTYLAPIAIVYFLRRFPLEKIPKFVAGKEVQS
ncbi:MAG TPA: hypothetical protein VJN71_09810 [Nitrososphaerales archaeon]|nr:hypothetical protein [Nitrososphaerales archaeon]